MICFVNLSSTSLRLVILLFVFNLGAAMKEPSLLEPC